METVGAVKNRKVGREMLEGDNGFDADFGSVSEKKAYDLSVAVEAELDPKIEKKKTKKRKKDAVELEKLGDGGVIMGNEGGGSVCQSEDKTKLERKKRKKERKQTDKDTMELEEPNSVEMGKGDDSENGGPACESEDKIMLDKKRRKKEKKKADKDTFKVEEPDNVDVGEVKGKKNRKETGNIPPDVEQDTIAAGDVKSCNKEREKRKDRNDVGDMRKEKVSQRKDKGKRVSFTDSVEVFGDDVDDKESDEGSEPKLVHGKRYTKVEDEKIMEAIRNWAEVKQLGDNILEQIRASFNITPLKDCWHEISKALPHRPLASIRSRARILLYRDNKRKWTEEEYEIIRQFVAKHGTKWKTLAHELGKSDIHVKDTWRRIKPVNLRKGPWEQEEYQNLFDLVNMDLRVKAHQKINQTYRNIRDNISWEAISDKLTTRSVKDCCLKWYQELASSLVKQGAWKDSDDYRLVEALQKVDAVCLEDVDWDNLLDNRTGEVCRQRWNQMVRWLGGHRERSFIEQVEVLSRRYSPEMIEYRK